MFDVCDDMKVKVVFLNGAPQFIPLSLFVAFKMEGLPVYAYHPEVR